MKSGNELAFDPTTPSVARVYDCFLGGKDNFAADRELAHRLAKRLPDLPDAVRANREFLGRAVMYLAKRGIEQFIDVGTGLPSQENVHQVARRVRPDARVVYVDHDPIVACHGRALLSREHGVEMIEADARLPSKILDAPETRRLIDWDKPVGLILVAVLHFMRDPLAVLHDLCESVAPGSFVVITHACPDRLDANCREAAVQDYNRSIDSPIHLRSKAEIAGLFAYLGCRLVVPGLVEVSRWRPDNVLPSRPKVTAFLGGRRSVPEGCGSPADATHPDVRGGVMAFVPADEKQKYVLAFRGLGPYCLVRRRPDIRGHQSAKAMCGRSVIVSSPGGEPVAWEKDDTVCAACVKKIAKRRVA